MIPVLTSVLASEWISAKLFLPSEMAEDPNKQADDHDKTTNNQTTKK
jgi:hypothetical protein